MPRRPNPRAIRKHRNYTVDEAARALGAAKVTVRRWLKAGLPALTDRRPTLILGADLIAHLGRKPASSGKCQLHECYCFSCRAPRGPAFAEVEFRPMTPTNGNLRALCEVCATVMHKRVSTARLPALRAAVAVTIVEADGRLSKGAGPCLNDHLPNTGQTHGEAPPEERADQAGLLPLPGGGPAHGAQERRSVRGGARAVRDLDGPPGLCRRFTSSKPGASSGSSPIRLTRRPAGRSPRRRSPRG